MKRTFLAIFIFAVLAACAGYEPSVQKSTIEHVTERNYTIDQRQQAFVGDSLVRVKDYYVRKLAQETVSAEQSVEIRMNLRRPVVVPAARALTVLGTREHNDRQYRVVRVPELQDGGQMLLTPDGRLTGEYLNMYGMVTPLDKHKVLPEGVRFISGQETIVVRDREFHNFELIYSGSSAGSMNLLYREYAPGDLVRAAFTQELTYDLDAERIRFRQVQLDVHRADSQSIEYTVRSDGL